jgi:hypothetical protein
MQSVGEYQELGLTFKNSLKVKKVSINYNMYIYIYIYIYIYTAYYKNLKYVVVCVSFYHNFYRLLFYLRTMTPYVPSC